MNLDPRLRLILITDGVGDLGRIVGTTRAAFAGGCRCVQVREPRWSARELEAASRELRPIAAEAGALILVNDRLDVVLAGCADGAQIGHRSLAPTTARRLLGGQPLLGYSAHNASELAVAYDAGCSFALLSPVWATASKPGREPLGVSAAARLTSQARLPTVWLGGVTPEALVEAADLAADARPAGVAVMSGIMAADDPAGACSALLQALPQ